MNMMRVLLGAILSVLTICFCACNGDIVKEPESFLKQKDALPWFSRNNICDIEGREYVIFYADSIFCTLDMETNRIDTIFTGASK